MAVAPERLPFFEKDMEYVGVAKLRQRMKKSDLMDLKKPILVIDVQSNRALAVLLNFEQYVAFLEIYMETIRPAMEGL